MSIDGVELQHTTDLIWKNNDCKISIGCSI